MSTVIIKLGSSLVADETGHPRVDVLAGVCAQTAELHEAGRDVVIVTSGAIAHGVGVMGLKTRPRAIDELQAASAIGQGRLYRHYNELLGQHKVKSAQVLLTFHDINGERENYLNARQTLRKLLDWRLVPVINENDTTATDEITFGDNDFLAAQIAILLGAELLVLLTSTDGVYTADPREDPQAELVPLVEDFTTLEALDIRQTTTALGSGGMRSKVIASEMATAAGIPAVIANGLADNAITDAVAGAPIGTRFPARKSSHSSFKLWLRYAKPTRGKITVDAGAARALREGGTSLLPVGIIDVNGGFQAGDAVIVVHEGLEIGKGISNYSAAELSGAKGMNSAQAQAVLPRASEEAIHRDYFVLTPADPAV